MGVRYYYNSITISLSKGRFMIEEEHTFISSILHVVAKEVDPSQDLVLESDQSIDDLINEEKEKNKKK